MSPFELMVLSGLFVLVALAGAQIVMTRENRKALERLARGEAARMMLARREVTISSAPAGTVAPLPKLSPDPESEDSPEPAGSPRERATRVDAPRSSGPRNRLRDSSKAPDLGPTPSYAEQARRPAPDADDPPESPPDARLAAEPAARVSQTVLPPPPQPPGSRANMAIAPPGSAPRLSPEPGIIAASLGGRPSEKRSSISERPPPHAPPRKRTLAGIPPAPQPQRIAATLASMPAVAPVSPRAAPSVLVIGKSDDGERSPAPPDDEPEAR